MGARRMTVQARIRLVLLGFFLATVASCGGSESGSGGAATPTVYVIKFPHVVAQATPKGQMAQRFKELAEQRFPGRVRVEVYPSAQLMEDTESIEALAFGEVQMIAVSLSLFDRLTQKFQVFDLPFLFPDLAAVERFQSSPAGRELLTTLTEHGIVGLSFWHNGMKQFTGPRPFIAPDDARGLKFRVMESDILQAEIEAIGGSPQKMAFGEVLSGAADGDRRRAGEHLVEHLLVEVLRSAIEHHREQSRLHRLLRRRERRVLGIVARRRTHRARGRARGSDAVG